ncbi:MAG: ABC transporter substrate-binding protein [Undibacterium sp.]|nr:ABC transporter substrate-binding protein [Undibacterium sp.]
MRTFTKLFAIAGVALGALIFTDEVFALEAPDALIKRVSQEIIEIARSDKEIQAGNRQRILALVEEKIVPHLDFRRATALTLGRYWRDATPEQQQQLIGEFSTLLIYTYSGAMSLIKDQKLKFLPLRADPADTEVEVHSQVLLPKRPEPVKVAYRLYKSPDGWKIYDVNVLGVWLSETYKGSFSAIINESGIDGLIQVLSDKNKKRIAADGGEKSKP